MNTTSQNLVYVDYHGGSEKERMGRLLFKNRVLFFEYDRDFIKRGLELSPFKLPLTASVIISPDRTFGGLFGVFNDSLPDGWGRLLLERQLMRAGIPAETLSPLDRLCFVGKKGMGALSFEPEHFNDALKRFNDLDEIDDQVQATLNENDCYVEDLFFLAGSSAGARPKVLLRIDHTDWLIKFRSSLDPKDISAIEYAYHLMAKKAGLSVPKAKIFPSKKGFGFFGVERFDRKGEERIHMHTISGLLHADHREPCLDYESIMKATLHLTKDVRQCKIQFRNAVFNVLSHNRDDHSKNFSFLMDAKGQWTVSPAYDLTFSSGPAGEHSTLIMGEGKHPTQKHLLALANLADIRTDEALDIIHQVSAATQQWNQCADEAGVSKLQTQNIAKALDSVLKQFSS